MQERFEGWYTEGTRRSGKYLQLAEVASPINEYLSSVFNEQLTIFPGTVNLRMSLRHTFAINRAIRTRGQWFMRSPRSLPYWILPGVAYLIKNNQAVDAQRVGVLYPIAKTDTKDIEFVGFVNFRERWNLDSNSCVYITEYGQTINEANKQ